MATITPPKPVAPVAAPKPVAPAVAPKPAVSPTLLNWYNNKTAQPVVQNNTGMIDHVKNYVVDKPQTTQGQLEGIIKQDSPLMQMARSEGMQQANERGLLNSSIAVGAAQDAVIKNALPIAESDAEKYNRAAGYNVDEYNKALNANAQNTFASNERVAAQNYNTSERLGKQAYDTKERIANNQYDFQKQTQVGVGQLGSEFNKMIVEINKDPYLNQQAKDWAIKQAYDNYRANITLLSAVGRVPNVSSLLAPMRNTAKPAANYFGMKNVPK